MFFTNWHNFRSDFWHIFTFLLTTIKTATISVLLIFQAFFVFQTVAETLNPKNQVTDSVTGQILGEYHEWIYIYEPQSKQWKKLIPGRCPQWIPNSKAFIYFLDVGYDGNRAELWQAKANGEGRVRITKSNVFISTTPMISPVGDR